MKKTMVFNKKEIIACIIFSLMYVFGVLVFTGTLFSGYHLVDDHEIIRRVYAYQNNELTLFDKVLAGFPWISLRFRPLYLLLRRIRCVVFLDNFFIWSVWVGVEIAFTIVFAYLVARMFKCSKYMSFLFGIIIVTGEQSAIWWRLGPQEPTGILLLMLSVFLLQKYEVLSKKRWLLAGTICAFVTSMAKESFTLVLPFVPFLMIAYDLYVNDTEAPMFDKCRNSLKKNALLLVVCISVFLGNISLILTQVGTDLAGYAGVDNTLGILGYIRRMGGMLLFRFSIYFWGLVAVAIGCLLYIKIKKINIKKIVFNNAFLFLTSLGIIFAQLLLHAKSGMHERYFIPTTVAVALIAIVIVNDIVSENKKIILYYQVLLTVSMLVMLITSVIPEAKEFASAGEDVYTCVKQLEAEGASDSRIIADLDEERNYAIETYFEYKLGYTTVLSCESGEFIDQINLKSAEMTIDSFEEVEYIIGGPLSNYDNFILIGDLETIKLWKNAEL